MILYEFEGKQLLQQAGITVPKSQLIEQQNTAIQLQNGAVIKAQVLFGKRAEVGGILFSNDPLETQQQVQKLLGQTINQETVKKVLVEEKIDIAKEYYLSLSYDTEVRGAILSISQQGGTGIEDRGVEQWTIDPITQQIANDLPVEPDLVQKLVKLFFDQDCLLLEINPLVQTVDGQWIALDAKINLDDAALKRHPDWQYPPRSAGGHRPTEREIAAKKIDETDYRGVAGSTYFDLPGDIAILASGGGASLTAMDALIKVGGKPANYTEYSGNPPREKVEKLTEIVMSKPNLHGLWVVGAIANFTDIYETLSGFIEGLRQAQSVLGIKFDFPIVIRRGGPRDDEAFAMLRQVTDFDLHLYGEETSIAQSAKIMAELAEKYATKS